MPIPELDPRESEPVVGEAEDSREAWLSLALAEGISGAGLAAAARGGRPLPRRDEPQP